MSFSPKINYRIRQLPFKKAPPILSHGVRRFGLPKIVEPNLGRLPGAIDLRAIRAHVNKYTRATFCFYYYCQSDKIQRPGRVFNTGGTAGTRFRIFKTRLNACFCHVSCPSVHFKLLKCSVRTPTSVYILKFKRD